MKKKTETVQVSQLSLRFHTKHFARLVLIKKQQIKPIWRGGCADSVCLELLGMCFSERSHESVSERIRLFGNYHLFHSQIQYLLYSYSY